MSPEEQEQEQEVEVSVEPVLVLKLELGLGLEQVVEANRPVRTEDKVWVLALDGSGVVGNN